jgi:DNA-directed RNA polymerase subunit M/transcription elongation factor TFIIS
VKQNISKLEKTRRISLILKIKNKIGFKCDRCGNYVSEYFQDTVTINGSDAQTLVFCPACMNRFKRHYRKYLIAHPEEVAEDEPLPVFSLKTS